MAKATKKAAPGKKAAPTKKAAPGKKAAAPEVSGKVEGARLTPKQTKRRAEDVRGVREGMRQDAKKGMRQDAKKDIGAPPTGGGEEANYAPPPVPAGVDPARRALENYVKMAGFPASMVDDLIRAQGEGLIDGNSQVEDYIAVGVGNKDFQARFPSIVDQWKKLQAGDMSVQLMTPVQVRDYETEVRNAADDYGLSSWVSSPAQIAALIGGKVDATEAVERINQAGYAASAAPPEFRQAFLKRYGLTEGNLVGFFLDPDKEEGEIKKAIGQGQIVAAAIQNGFQNNWGTGEKLWDRGVSADQAMSGFARAALSRGLGSGLGARVSEDAMIGSEFGDAAATAEVTSVAAQRTGRFSGAGGAAESQKGISGLGAASTT